MDQFLQDAIGQGLKQDDISAALTAKVLSQDRFFIGKCNICKNVKKAFEEHEGPSTSKAFKGQAEKIQQVGQGGSNGKEAFKQVVNHYIDQHFAVSGLSKDKKASLQKEMLEEAKKRTLLLQDRICQAGIARAVFTGESSIAYREAPERKAGCSVWRLWQRRHIAFQRRDAHCPVQKLDFHAGRRPGELPDVFRLKFPC